MATYFYALRNEQKSSYEVKVDREKFYAEFENRLLRPGEDPAVFLWELTQLLTRANPSLTEDSKTALLERQFMRGLPARTRLKLLEQDATPSLDAMVSFAQRFRELDTEHFAANSTAHLSTGKNDQPPDMSTLVAAVKALQVEHQSLRNEITQQRQQARPVSATRGVTCYECGERGHYARACQYRQNTSRGTANNPIHF